MIGNVSNNSVWYVDFKTSNHITNHGKWFRDTKFENIGVYGHWWWHFRSHHINWQGAIVHVRWVNKIFERPTIIKKISFGKADGGTKFTSDIQP